MRQPCASGIHRSTPRQGSCATGRAVLASEHEQRRCAGDETALGSVAYGWCSDAGQKIFGSSRKRSGLTYDVALKELADDGDATAAAAKVAKATNAGSDKTKSAAAKPVAPAQGTKVAKSGSGRRS